MALERDLEGQLVPAADLLNEPFVAPKGEQPLGAESPGRQARGECITHGNAIDSRRFTHYPGTFPLDPRLSHMSKARLAWRRTEALSVGQAGGPFRDPSPVLGP